MQHTTIAVDHAKSVFQVAISTRPGRVDREHRMSRARFERFVAEQPRSRVLLEACGSAHHWGRVLQQHGHEVILLPPHHVRRYRAGNKTDAADTKALLEAFRNEDLHPVPVKSKDQQALVALHRARSAWMHTRIARLNHVRGQLREFGILIPAGARKVLPTLRRLLAAAAEEPNSTAPAEETTTIPEVLLPLLREMVEEIRTLDQRIDQVEHMLEELGAQDPAVVSLRSVPGIGLLTSTALVAFVGNIHRFRSGRRFASFLGLTPREHSSGLTRRLGSISKRGDPYLRTLLIHGARSLRNPKTRTPKPLRDWALQVHRRRGSNIATVALANRLARIAWAVWKEERAFMPAR